MMLSNICFSSVFFASIDGIERLGYLIPAVAFYRVGWFALDIHRVVHTLMYNIGGKVYLNCNCERDNYTRCQHDLDMFLPCSLNPVDVGFSHA